MGASGSVGMALCWTELIHESSLCIFPGDQAVILVGMGALEAERGEAVFLSFFLGVLRWCGLGPLLPLMYPVWQHR